LKVDQLAQVFGKKLFAEGDGRVLVGFVEAVRQPNVLGALDDEGGGQVVKLVDVGLEPAVFGFLKQEGEGVVLAVRAQPNETVGPRHDVGLEHLGQPAAHPRVDAVAGDHQVGIGKIEVGGGVLLKQQLDPQLLAARLQNVE
jgi:hypothetical protein